VHFEGDNSGYQADDMRTDPAEHTLYTSTFRDRRPDAHAHRQTRVCQNWNNDQEAITSYSVLQHDLDDAGTNAQQTGTLVQQTALMGRSIKSFTRFGLGCRTDAVKRVLVCGVKKKWISTPGHRTNTALSYPQNPRVAGVKHLRRWRNRRRTTIDYTSYSLPSVVREWTGSGELLFTGRHRRAIDLIRSTSIAASSDC